MGNRKWTTILASMERDVAELKAGDYDLPVGEMPDLGGRARAVEVALASLRKDWNETQIIETQDPESEFGPGTFAPEPSPFGGKVHPKVVGKSYRTVSSTAVKRTYSTAPIIAGIGEAEEISPIDALMFALDNGLAKMEWKWTPLRNYCEARGLALRKVDGKIEDSGDLDGPWIGEDKKTTTRQEAIPDDK